jgi:hypothetical protein
MRPPLDITLHKKTLLGEETRVDDGIFLDLTTGIREHGWTQKPSPSIAPFSRMDIQSPSTHTHTHTNTRWMQPLQCEYRLFTNHQWTVNVNSMYSQIMDEVLMWIPPPIPNHGWSVDVNTTTYSQSWMKGWSEHNPPPIKGWQTEPSYGGYHIYSGHAFMERESSSSQIPHP